MDKWQALKENLQKEADAIRESSGEIIELRPDPKSELDMALHWKAKRMRLTYIPRNNSVRWETAVQHGFEEIPEFTPSLAVDLMQMLARR